MKATSPAQSTMRAAPRIRFVSVDADIGFQIATDSATGATEILAGATNATMVLGNSATNVTISGASFGLLVNKLADAPASYALLSSGGNLTLTGLPTDISFSVTDFAVQINNTGLDLTTLAGAGNSIHTSGGDVTLDFSTLGTGNVEAIQGTATLTIANSGVSPAGLSFAGNFAFARQTDPANANVTRILVGLSNASAFIGTTTSDGTPLFGLSLTNGQLGLAIYATAAPRR